MSRTHKKIVRKGSPNGAKDNFRRVGKLIHDQIEEVFASEELIEALKEIPYNGPLPTMQRFHNIAGDKLKVGAYDHVPPCKQPK